MIAQWAMAPTPKIVKRDEEHNTDSHISSPTMIMIKMFYIDRDVNMKYFIGQS
jgi:hypothetical protein